MLVVTVCNTYFYDGLSFTFLANYSCFDCRLMIETPCGFINLYAGPGLVFQTTKACIHTGIIPSRMRIGDRSLMMGLKTQIINDEER
jgi:hypothetical protein